MGSEGWSAIKDLLSLFGAISPPPFYDAETAQDLFEKAYRVTCSDFTCSRTRSMQTIPESPSEWICPEPDCDSRRFVDREGWRWCLVCGIGTMFLEVPHKVPGVGSDTHYAPENQLCFGRDLGNPAVNSRRDQRALYKVLALNRKEDLGIRAIRIKNECMRSQESPVTQRMKSIGSSLCKRYGFGDNVLLSNALGFNLKWIGSILTTLRDGSHSKDLTVAAFVLSVKKFYGWGKAVEIMLDLWGQEKDLKLFIPKSKKRFIAKARDLILLDKLVI
jgi:hypothetical protein